MQKKEIISLLEYQKNTALSHYLDKPGYRSYSQRREDILDYNLPNIEGISKSLSIIDKELFEIKSKKQNAINYLKEHEQIINHITCTHPMIFKKSYFLGSSYYCILCGQETSEISDAVTINKGYYDDDYDVFVNEYTFEEIYDIIINILKKYKDDDNIDLKKEFKEQFELGNIGSLSIDNTQYSKTYNILILSGSNIAEVDSAYLTKKTSLETEKKIKEIYGYLTNITRFRTKLLTSHLETLSTNYNIIEFTTLPDLLAKIDQNINYDLIIDLSNLFTYHIMDNKLIIDNYDLNLQAMFPDSYIIKMDNNLTEELAKIANKNIFSNDFKKLILKK